MNAAIAETVPFVRTEKAANQNHLTTDTGIFTSKSDGVYFAAFGKDGQAQAEKRICSPLRVLAMTRSHQQTQWGMLLEWSDYDHHLHRWAMPWELLKGDSTDLIGELLRRGLYIPHGRKNKVIEYVQSSQPGQRMTCTDKTGWHAGAYVTPEKVHGAEASKYIYQTEGAGIDAAYSVSGTLDDWKTHVAAYAVGNSRLLFSVSAAFAGALLEPANVESGGFHLVGGSSSGKSTAQRVAASVWGHPDTFKRSWRATSNGLEGVASLYNDNILILDEISEMSSKDASETAYMLGNGQGKQRAAHTGNAKAVKIWKTLFLSSGEVTLQDMLQEDGGRRRVKVGQEVRIANLQADAGAGMGILEHLHQFGKPAALADHLRYESGKHHGAAGSAWLDIITRQHRELWDTLPEAINQFCDRILPDEASGQVHRVARRFGLVAVAGELATQHGLTGWKAGQATAAAKRCFSDWLVSFGVGNREDKQILDAVLGFLERNSARFQDMSYATQAPVLDQVGYKRPVHEGVEFIIPVRQLDRLAEGFNPDQVISVLRDNGLLNAPDNQGKNAIQVRTPEGNKRCYIITPQAEETA